MHLVKTQAKAMKVKQGTILLYKRGHLCWTPHIRIFHESSVMVTMTTEAAR